MTDSLQFRPNCLNKDRIRLWIPASSSAHTLPLALHNKKLHVLLSSVRESTRNTYGTGLACYHLFCDKYKLPWSNRAPASPELISAFVAYLAGHYSASSINNYLSGVRLWHLVHSQPWRINQTELHSLLRGARLLQPQPKQQRQPLLLKDIQAIMQKLELDKPLPAAAFACLTTTFFSCARLGEFTILTLKSFNPNKYITPNGVSVIQDIKGESTTTFHLPQTKTNPFGENVYWKSQPFSCDPEKALINHLVVNKPLPHHHLFSYKVKGKHRPLTRNAFLVTIKEAAQKAGIAFHFGHSLRIGGTLEYLIRGVPLEVIKRQGRWKSDAFALYLRNHAQVLSPYLSHNISVQNSLLQAIQPPL